MKVYDLSFFLKRINQQIITQTTFLYDITFNKKQVTTESVGLSFIYKNLEKHSQNQ